MCLVVLALNAHPDYPLILVGNRDEFHHRPTEAMHWWSQPPILAGRDLTARGTWLGVTGAGRVATVTNYRDPDPPKDDALSRGQLVVDALQASDMRAFGDGLVTGGGRYNGFNLLWGEPGRFYYVSNQDGPVRQLAPGLHGLSNGLLDTPWPKLLRLREAVGAVLKLARPVTTEALMAPFMDTRPADDSSLPDTGVPKDWERMLSSPFIVSQAYGTRACTAVLVAASGAVTVREQSFGVDGSLTGDQTFAWC